MERVSNTEPLPSRLRSGVIALGTFDGVHRGHQAIMAKARAMAGAEGRPLIIATAEPNPVLFFDPAAEPFALTTLSQRERLFRQVGADAMLVFDFDERLARLSAEAFIEEEVCAMAGASAIVMSRDAGAHDPHLRDFASLAAAAQRRGIRVESVDLVADATAPISSTRARKALRDGDCEAATMLLTRPFTIEGIVQHGHKVGRPLLGFPTANMLLGQYVRPRYGVYAVRGRLPGGRVIDGVANFGIRPMFEPPEELLEPHFLDFTGDLYDQTIEVEMIRFIRGEAKLSGIDELQRWIARDCEAARAILATIPHQA